nr:uncharacterized protein LOC108060535 [Drosophila takahashii]
MMKATTSHVTTDIVRKKEGDVPLSSSRLSTCVFLIWNGHLRSNQEVALMDEWRTRSKRQDHGDGEAHVAALQGPIFRFRSFLAEPFHWINELLLPLMRLDHPRNTELLPDHLAYMIYQIPIYTK